MVLYIYTSGGILNVYTIPFEAAEDWSDYLDIIKLGQRGKISISFTDTNPQTSIAAGSMIEIQGDLYHFPTDEVITNTGIFSTAGSIYIRFVVSGDTVTAEYTDEPPSWSNTDYGWYRDGNRYYPGYWTNIPDASNIVDTLSLTSGDYRRGMTIMDDNIYLATYSAVRGWDLSGNIIHDSSSPSGYIRGLANDGTNLHVITEDGWYSNGSLITSSIPTPTSTIDGAHIHNDTMYILKESIIYEYDLSGAFIHSYSIGIDVQNITALGNIWYLSDYMASNVYSIVIGDTYIKGSEVFAATEVCDGMDFKSDGTLLSLGRPNFGDPITVNTHSKEFVFLESFVPQILTLEV